MNPETTSQITKSLINIDTKVLTMVYEDLAKPGVQQVGHALSTVLGLGNTALLPIKLLNEKANALFSKHMDEYRKRLSEIPEEKIVEVSPEIGVPILEKLEKTTNNKVSELYINLLTNASNIDFVSETHPRFISIIESITSDEVKIMESFKEISYTPFITILYNEREIKYGETPNPFSQTMVKVLNKQATVFETNKQISLPEMSKFYFQNLEGLSLLHTESERFLGGSAYEYLLEYFADVINKQQESEAAYLTVNKGWYELTNFGHLFLKACRNNGST